MFLPFSSGFCEEKLFSKLLCSPLSLLPSSFLKIDLILLMKNWIVHLTVPSSLPFSLGSQETTGIIFSGLL